MRWAESVRGTGILAYRIDLYRKISMSRYGRRLQILHGKWLKSPCALCSAVAYCCGAVAPRAIAALLGRFLPRLGPLASCERPFFLAQLFFACCRSDCLGSSLLSRGLKRPQRIQRRSEEHTSELQSQFHLVCRLL